MEILDTLPPHGRSFEDFYQAQAKSDFPAERRMGEMMLELFEALRRGTIGPRLHALKTADELWLSYSSGTDNYVSIGLKVDYKDRTPMVNGLPQFHYRLSYEGSLLNERPLPLTELRTRDLRTACDFIGEAIERCRRGY